MGNGEWDAEQIEKLGNTNTELLNALKRHVAMFNKVCNKIDFGDMFMDAETIAEWNNASIEAARAIQRAEKEKS